MPRRSYSFAPLKSVLFLVLIFANAAAAAERNFPYRVKVSAREAQVRSGPGETYYPTSKLQAGDEVEVYRHDPGGWCAIRPPQGSFSWISSRQARVTRDKIAVVEGERVVSRVGSSLTGMRDVIQVRLDRGEELEVLDDRGGSGGAGDERFIKVAPPAGEFRWISSQALDRDVVLAHDRTGAQAKELAGDESPTANKTKGWVAKPPEEDAPSENQLVSAQEPRSQASRTRGSAPLFRPAAKSTAAPEATSESQTKRESATDDSRRDPPRTARPSRESTAKSGPTSVDELDLELSQIVVEEPMEWDFSELRARVETTMDRAESALDRGRARQLLARIDRFDELRKRQADVARAQKSIARSERDAAPAESKSDRYEGEGTLRQVVSRQTKLPGYALFDERGKLTHYVSPSPGVSLQNYVGKQIGVDGTRDYSPELSAPHVTARQIDVLRR